MGAEPATGGLDGRACQPAARGFPYARLSERSQASKEKRSLAAHCGVFAGDRARGQKREIKGGIELLFISVPHHIRTLLTENLLYRRAFSPQIAMKKSAPPKVQRSRSLGSSTTPASQNRTCRGPRSFSHADDHPITRKSGAR